MQDPPRRPGRPPKSQARDTRALLIDTALELFANHGYAGTSVRAVARAAGLSESALYAHFASKDEIFAALAQAGPESILSLLNADDLADADPPTLIRRLVDRTIDLWDQPRARQFTSILIRDGLLVDPRTGGDLKAAIDHVRHQLGARFAAWAAAGLLVSRTPAEQLVWELFSPIAYVRLLYLHAAATPQERATGRQLASRHIDFFVNAVFRRPDRS